MGSWRSGACGGEGGGGERGPSWTEAGSWLQSSSSGPPRSTPDVGALVVMVVVVEAGVSEVVASDVGASEVGLSGVGLLWVEVSVVLPEVSGASTSECTYEQLQGLGLISGLGEREREASRLGAHQPEVLAPVRDARAAHLLRHGHVGLHDELPLTLQHRACNSLNAAGLNCASRTRTTAPIVVTGLAQQPVAASAFGRASSLHACLRRRCASLSRITQHSHSRGDCRPLRRSRFKASTWTVAHPAPWRQPQPAPRRARPPFFYLT